MSGFVALGLTAGGRSVGDDARATVLLRGGSRAPGIRRPERGGRPGALARGTAEPGHTRADRRPPEPRHGGRARPRHRGRRRRGACLAARGGGGDGDRRRRVERVPRDGASGGRASGPGRPGGVSVRRRRDDRRRPAGGRRGDDGLGDLLLPRPRADARCGDQDAATACGHHVPAGRVVDARLHAPVQPVVRRSAQPGALLRPPARAARALDDRCRVPQRPRGRDTAVARGPVPAFEGAP